MVARMIHIIAGLALGTFVYAPAEYVEPIRLALQVAIIPAIVVTGVFMWKQAAVRRLFRRIRHRDGAAGTGSAG